MSFDDKKLMNIIESLILAYGQPISLDTMLQVFDEENKPSKAELKSLVDSLIEAKKGSVLEIKEVASGYRPQINQDYAPFIARLWEEKAPRYTRALLETLVLVAYRQPITRAEVEEVRGVSVSSNIVKTLLEREWVRVVGHRDVPGKPALYATTKKFLDYFNLKSLEDLPTLDDIANLDEAEEKLENLETQLELAMQEPLNNAENTQESQEEFTETQEISLGQEIVEEQEASLEQEFSEEQEEITEEIHLSLDFTTEDFEEEEISSTDLEEELILVEEEER